MSHGRQAIWGMFLLAAVLLALSTQGCPQGPSRGAVVFIFADGPAGAYDDAYPRLAARGWAGVALVNPTTIGRRGKLSEAECVILDRAGWDISSHGYRHDNPTLMTPEELDLDLRLAHDWLTARGFARGARHYAPPLQANQAVRDAALRYFQTVLPGDSLSEWAVLPPGWIYDSHTTSETCPWMELEAVIDHAREPGHVICLNFHRIVLSGPVGLDTSVARLDAIIDCIASQGICVLTLSDLLDGSASP
jgi:peptidoglycan/xylan/chitin deacetylase (PgdA/CDA1 family)